MKKILNTIVLLLVVTLFAGTVGLSTANSQQKKLGGIVRLVDMSGQFFCTAFVVSDKLAYTAAHCMMEEMFWAVSSDGKTKVIAYPHKVSDDRRDLATISGDFTIFEKLKIDTRPEGDIVHQNLDNMKSCGYPYGSTLICYNISSLKKLGFAIVGIGQLYSGMSGGPLMKDGVVYGVNHAFSNLDERVLFQPLIGSENLME